MKKKKFDLFDEAMDVGTVSVGTMAVGGITSKLGERLPSSSTGRINKGVGMMGIFPTIKATGSVFGGLRELEYRVKKKR